MKKLSLFTLLLILACSIRLSAQHGNNPDTVRCYGIKELQKIADVSVRGQVCNDSLLPNCKLEVEKLNALVTKKDQEISNLDKQITTHQELLKINKEKAEALKNDITRLERHKRWLKLGWVTTTSLLGGILIYMQITR